MYYYLGGDNYDNDILLVKKDEKTENKEIIDEVKNGIIIVENTQSEDRDVQKLFLNVLRLQWIILK